MTFARTILLLGSMLVVPMAAAAGLNPSASAQMYWQTGTNGAGRGQRDDTTSTPQLVVTVTGVNNIRGADVQIHYWPLRHDLPMPSAWQFQSGGCAAGAAQFLIGGPGGFYPNLFTSSPPVTALATTQDVALFATGDCLTPHGSGLLWLSTLGSLGRERSPLVEYAVWAISFDLRPISSGGVANCAGGPSDPSGPVGICLHADHRVPCNDPQREGVLELFDGSATIDVVPFVAGRSVLTWHAGGVGTQCESETPAPRTTWGRLKSAYR